MSDKALSITLSPAAVRVADGADDSVLVNAARVLREELASRTATAAAGDPHIVLEISGKEGIVAEGFRVVTRASGSPAVTITGADGRGALFGVGWVLRHCTLSEGVVTLPDGVDVSSAPDYPIRGHQLGYRFTANSYDAWSVEQFERYIRELAFFGVNAIEGIPGGGVSPHWKASAEEMNVAISRICQTYGLDYWHFWAAPNHIGESAEKTEERLAESDRLWAETPFLTDVFVPGGDPGDSHPSELMPYLERLSAILKRHHPNAGVWTSLQKFNAEWTDWILDYIEREQPDWLAGIVDGPWAPHVREGETAAAGALPDPLVP